MPNSHKKAIYCTDIPVATRIDTEDTTSMQFADFSTMRYLEGPKLDAIATKLPGPNAIVFLVYLLHPICIVKMLLALRKAARKAEEEASFVESQWKELVKVMPPAKVAKYVAMSQLSPPREIMLDHQQSLRESLAAATGLERFFPRTIKRLQIAIQRTIDVESYWLKMIPVFDEKMVESARSHYDNGTLMDLETFANGLRGN